MSSPKFFRHRYGGIYQHLHTAKSTGEASSVEVYRHLWPFEPGVWVRPSTEFWDGRFQAIHIDDVIIAQEGNRAKAQAAVNAAKAAAKKQTAAD